MPDHAVTNLASLLDHHAKARPTHPAVIFEKDTLNYAVFAGLVRRFATRLTAEGVRQGALVGVGLRDRPAHLVMLFAVMRLGAVVVPVDCRWTQVETEALATHFALDFLVVEPEAPAIEGPKRITVDLDWDTAPVQGTKDAPMVEAPDLPMILSLSSGTTGRPTGPLLTHAQMWARTENQLATLTFHQHDRYLLATPLYFGGGRAFALTHLLIGATLILCPPPYAPQDLAAVAARTQATSTFLVPTLIRRLLGQQPAVLAGFKSLRLLISSGAPLHADERAEIESRLCAGFIEYFASTEGGGISVMVPSERDSRPESVGRAAFRVDLQVVDDNHMPQPPGEVGKVRYRGPGVATEFFRETGKSQDAFRGGWFYPGDLGKLDEEGFLTLLGRAKSVIIRGGANIYPLEIERALETHPQVKEAAVYGLPDPDMGEEICATVAAEAGVTEQALQAHCRARLAPYKLPRQIRFVPELPRNSGGKVLIGKLQDAALAARNAGTI